MGVCGITYLWLDLGWQAFGGVLVGGFGCCRFDVFTLARRCWGCFLEITSSVYQGDHTKEKSRWPHCGNRKTETATSQ